MKNMDKTNVNTQCIECNSLLDSNGLCPKGHYGKSKKRCYLCGYPVNRLTNRCTNCSDTGNGGTLQKSCGDSH